MSGIDFRDGVLEVRRESNELDELAVEDAAHLYVLFGETLSRPELEHWVSELEVTDAYGRLQRA
ncbi:hypothetical protein BRC96_11125 [Halobacteriales archaeon QS_6_64_34]|nr:MAG: hypothetical protein BRC96_11125 [Halobacteriales archaeon QS_6_64_34]